MIVQSTTNSSGYEADSSVVPGSTLTQPLAQLMKSASATAQETTLVFIALRL